MGKIRMLQTGDAHLGAECAWLGARAPERQGELLQSFRRQMDYALDDANGIDIVLIAGDLFDSHNPKPSLVGEVRGLFQRVAATGRKIVIIPGTHDSYAYKDSVWKKVDFAPDAFVFTNINPGSPLHLYLQGQDLFIYGFAYDPINSRDPMNTMRKIDAAGLHIGLFHCSIIDRSDIDIRRKDLPVSSDKLASYGMQYIALGHYEDYKEIHDRQGRLVGAYAGAPEATRLAEAGDRHFAVVEIEDGRVAVQARKSNLREVSRFRVDVTGLQSMEDIFSACARCCADARRIAVFEVEGRPECIVDDDALRAMLRTQYFHAEVHDETLILDTVFVRQYGRETATIRRLFIDELHERIAGAKSDREREQLNLALKVGLSEFAKHRF